MKKRRKKHIRRVGKVIVVNVTRKKRNIRILDLEDDKKTINKSKKSNYTKNEDENNGN